MGKKSKRQREREQTGAQPAQPAQQHQTREGVGAGAINNKAVCRIVEEIWTKTQSAAPASLSLSALWQDHDSLQGLVRALREKQAARGLYHPLLFPSNRCDAITAFEHWLDTNGIDHSNVEIANFPPIGLGLRARVDLKVGEKVLVVPERLMMSSETARSGALGSLIAKDRLVQSMPNVALALHLLNEACSPHSFWRPYIDLLPSSYNTPLYFTKPELQMLQASPCLSESLQQIRCIVKLYTHLHKLIRAQADASLALHRAGFSYANFIWAVSTVMSRQNEILLGGGERKSLVLIPLWDLSNHTSGFMGTDFNADTRSCECYAAMATSKGEEFRIFYGPRTNSEFFTYQGFVYPDNKHDSLRIKLGLSSGEESESRQLKTQLLQRMALPVSGVFHIIPGDSPVTLQLKVFLRVFTAPPPRLRAYLLMGDQQLKEAITNPQWGPTDVDCLDLLEKRCSLLLKTYKTSVEEDERLLGGGAVLSEGGGAGLSEGGRLAVMVRLCEKKILGSVQEYAGRETEALRGGEEGEAAGINGTTERGGGRGEEGEAVGINGTSEGDGGRGEEESGGRGEGEAARINGTAEGEAKEIFFEAMSPQCVEEREHVKEAVDEGEKEGEEEESEGEEREMEEA